MNEYSVKKMSEYPVNPSPLSEDLIPTITVEGGKFVNRNIEFSKLKGDKGDTGPQGEPGDDGNTGASGKAATVEVGSVSTGPAGSSATVENTGDEYDAVLDFTIPKGDKGDQGDPGVVQSVNGKSQANVVLTPTDIGADTAGSASQALQDANDYTDAEIAAIDFPVDSVNGKTNTVVLDTDDIADTATNRYTNDSDIARLADTSGENTGDQDLSGLATDVELTAGLATKEPTISSGTTSQYYRGDKTWQTLNTTAVGIPNVNNTSDMDKPVSTAQAAALALKANFPSSNSNVPVRSGSGTQSSIGYSAQVSNDTIVTRTNVGTAKAATAVAADDLVPKAQMDTADALKVNKAGDTMTGRLENSVSTMMGYAQTRGGSQVLFGADVNGRFHAYNNTSGSSIITAESTGIALGFWDTASPRIVKGTGFPNGVVSAPVGSIYIDTAVTNGASSWIKKSGTGNTGWSVLEGDTGWRNISALIPPVSTTGGILKIRRINTDIYLQADNLYLTSTSSLTLIADIGVDLGVSFRPIENLSVVLSIGSGNAIARSITLRPASTTAGITHLGEISSRYWASSYYTMQAWPTTLPGTAA